MNDLKSYINKYWRYISNDHFICKLWLALELVRDKS